MSNQKKDEMFNQAVPRDYYRAEFDEGVVELMIPPKLSADSFAEFEGWLEIVMRRMKRNIIDKIDDIEDGEE